MKPINPTFCAAVLLASLLASLLTAGAQAQEETKPRQPQPSEILPLADRSILNDIEAVGDGFVAVGERGHILLSDDGKNWRQVQSPTRAMLTRVQFVDEQNGWAVGYDGVVIRSTDGGKTWEIRRFEPDWGKPFYDLLFESAGTGLVAGANGRMLVTRDAGETWTAVENEIFETGFHHYDVARLNDDSLLIAGERGFLARSLDSGETWDMLAPPYIGSYFGVLPRGPRGAVLYGLQGRVFGFDDISSLPTVADPLDYDPFTAENVTDPTQLEAMGWWQIQNPVVESLFGAATYGDDKAVFVGVDGSIAYGSLCAETLTPWTDWRSDDPLSDVVVRSGKLIMTGRSGFYHGKPPLEEQQ